jgi:hypothetical protein
MSINIILETLKAFAQALQVSTVFPAVLFILINTTLILPGTHIISMEEATSPAALLVGTTTALILSYTLYAFNFPLIRLLEGYVKKPKIFWEPFLSEKIRRFREMKSQLDLKQRDLLKYQSTLDKDQDPQKDFGWQTRYTVFIRLANKFEHNYPSGEGLVLPTELGNIVAAFEDYPRTRYGIESTALWQRLIPTLRKTKYIDFVAQEKTVFDFLMNTGFVVFILGVESVYFLLYLHRAALALFIFALTIALMMLFYHGLKEAALAWGSTVRVAFDIHRHSLRQELGLTLQKDFASEYLRWQEISKFYENRLQDFKKFEYFSPEEAVGDLIEGPDSGD